MLWLKTSGLFLIFLLSLVSLFNTFTFFYAYKHTTVALAVLTHYTAPFFVAILASIFLKERITFKIIISIISATVGMYLILDISFVELIRQVEERNEHTLGILSGLMSGFFYGLLIVLYKKVLPSIKTLPLISLQNLFITLMLLPIVSIPVNLKLTLPVILFIGIVQSTAAPLIYLKGVKQVRANTAAILGYIEPLSAILLGIIFLGEAVKSMTIIGGLLILISGLVCSFNQNR